VVTIDQCLADGEDEAYGASGLPRLKWTWNRDRVVSVLPFSLYFEFVLESETGLIIVQNCPLFHEDEVGQTLGKDRPILLHSGRLQEGTGVRVDVG